MSSERARGTRTTWHNGCFTLLTIQYSAHNGKLFGKSSLRIANFVWLEGWKEVLKRDDQGR